jgi:hypothetical protein
MVNKFYFNHKEDNKCVVEKIYILFNNIYVNKNIIQIQNMQDINKLYP